MTISFLMNFFHSRTNSENSNPATNSRSKIKTEARPRPFTRTSTENFNRTPFKMFSTAIRIAIEHRFPINQTMVKNFQPSFD